MSAEKYAWIGIIIGALIGGFSGYIFWGIIGAIFVGGYIAFFFRYFWCFLLEQSE